MADRLGTELFTDADYAGFDVAGGGSRGDAVQITGDREVTVTATADADVDGILGDDADAGERQMVYLHGAPFANVATGTAAGVYLTASATAGQLRGINTGGATGETMQNKGFKTATAEDGENQAVVLIQ